MRMIYVINNEEHRAPDW